MNADASWLITAGDLERQRIDFSFTDDEGATYIALSYEGTTDLAPGQTFVDDRDILGAPEGESLDAIVKFNAEGELDWVNSIDLLAESEAGRAGLRVDDMEVEFGGLYLAGRADGLVDLQAGNGDIGLYH